MGADRITSKSRRARRAATQPRRLVGTTGRGRLRGDPPLVLGECDTLNPCRDDSRMDSEKVLKRRRKRLLNDWGYSRETLVAYFVNNI